MEITVTVIESFKQGLDLSPNGFVIEVVIRSTGPEPYRVTVTRNKYSFKERAEGIIEVGREYKLPQEATDDLLRGKVEITVKDGMLVPNPRGPRIARLVESLKKKLQNQEPDGPDASSAGTPGGNLR